MKNAETMKMREEIKNHLINGIIPFWKGMRDNEFGGYYGWLDYNLNLDKKAEKRLHPEQQDHLVLLQRIYTVKRRKSVG